MSCWGYCSDDGDIAEEIADCTDESETQGKNYMILKESDIRQRMESDITALSSVLSVTKQEASILLRHYNWCVTNVHEAWFADESGVRKKVGLVEEAKEQHTDEGTDDHGDRYLTCGICFDLYSLALMKFAGCGHPFCDECWRQYVNVSVEGGLGCLTLKCPQPECGVAVGEDIIDAVAFEEDKKKYYRYLVRSYVEDNKTRKWCPALDCDYAVDFAAGDHTFDVSCLCSHTFCWQCCEEKHRPIDCDTVAKWNLRNNSEAENVAWKKAYTKPCPQCQRPIEKAEGCMHMTCSKPCGFQYCWLCLGEWFGHQTRACNAFEDKGGDKEANELRENLRRYQHYYVRWAANEKSRQIALRDLQGVQKHHTDCSSGLLVSSDIDSLEKAWKQIVECRRVLKWTYAYEFYLPDYEDVKKEFFEYLQGEAERSLERLHNCAEKEFLEEVSYEPCKQVKKKLVTLTKVTRTYFENLVRALENDLSDVTCKRPGASDVDEYRAGIDLGADQLPVDLLEQVNNTVEEEWYCGFCSYLNPGSAAYCELCSRGSWTCQICTFNNPKTATTCQMCNVE